MMQGRRFSEGLHQALEAKEDVTVQPENVTLASITFQNYFRLYDKLAGMTGTAMTEAAEFMDIYKLDVMDIPTNLRSTARITTTRFIAPTTRRTKPSSSWSWIASSVVSRCWSAPPPSRSPSSFPNC